MNQLGEKLALHLHFLRENGACFVLLKFLPQFLKIFRCRIGIFLLISSIANASFILLLVILERILSDFEENGFVVAQF